jgi:hypothetical protein
MRAAVMMLSASLLGCADQAHENDFQAGVPVLAALTRDLRQVLAQSAPIHACGPDRAFTSDRALLVLSARDCMSCRSAGYLLRQLGARTDFDVLTADQDVREVCGFVREEKAAPAVFQFKDRRFRNSALADRFLLFRRARGGGIVGVILEADPGDALARWDSLVRMEPVP